MGASWQCRDGRTWLLLLAVSSSLALGQEKPTPARAALLDKFAQMMTAAGYKRRGYPGHYPGTSIDEYGLPGERREGPDKITCDWTFIINDSEQATQAKVKEEVQRLSGDAANHRLSRVSLPDGTQATCAASSSTNDSPMLIGDPWVGAGAEVWFQVGTTAVKVYGVASRQGVKGTGQAQAQAAEAAISAWTANELQRVWAGGKEDPLRAAVRLVLRAIRKLPPVMAQNPETSLRLARDGSLVFATAPGFGAGGVRLIADDTFCPLWYALPAKADEALAPSLRLIVEASAQQPQKLAKELTNALYDAEVSRQVYFLMLAGMDGRPVLLNNLSARLPFDDKLLRYVRGRQRFCRQRNEAEWRQLVADGQFCAGIFFTTVDTLMSVTGFAGIQTSGAVLSYAQAIAKLLEQDPKLKDELAVDMQKLAINGFIQANPDWHWVVGSPQSFAETIVERWRVAWADQPGPHLPDAFASQLAAAPTEGAWLDLLDAEQKRDALRYAFNRALFDAFNRIFAVNGWNHEDRLPLEPANSNRWLHEQARREVERRADEARMEIPVLAWYSGCDAAKARTMAKAAGNAADNLFGGQ